MSTEAQAPTETTVDIMEDLDAFSSEFYGRNAETPPAANPEAEQDPAETTTEEVEADAQPSELTEEDEAQAEVELAKPKSKVQERIDELVRQREETKRDADAKIEAMRREFEDKLAALKPPEPVKPQTASSDAEPNPDALDAEGNPKYALGEFDPAYIRDLTRFTLNQERAVALQREAEERTVREQQAQATQLQESWMSKVEASKGKYPDLIEKATPMLQSFDNLPQNYAQYLTTVLQSMDHGPDVLYYLSNHPDEARTIVNSGAQKATLALGRIEAKFVEAEAQKQVAKPKVSSAPPPPPVSARGTGGAPPRVAPDTDDLNAFEREFFRGFRR